VLLRQQRRSVCAALAVCCGGVVLVGCGSSGALSRVGDTPAAAPAPATDDTEPLLLRLSYEAAPGCPAADAYVHDVETRSSALHVALPGSTREASQAIAIRVTVRKDAEHWLGELHVDGSDDPDRHVTGDRCIDVVTALALITVLRLDPRAPEARIEPPLARAALPEPRSAVAETRASSPPAAARDSDADATALVDRSVRITREVQERPPASAAEPERAAPVAREAPPPLAPAPSCPELPRSPSLVGRGGYVSAASHAVRLSLGLELSHCVLGAPWSAGLSFAYAGGSAATAAGDVSLDLFVARLSLCPLQLTLSEPVWLRACLALDAGLLSVSLSPEADFLAQHASRPWLATGPQLDLGLPLSPGWALRGLVGASVGFVRDEFVLERAEVEPGESATARLYRPELVSFEASLGVAYAF
jgi:hypothetical protein